MGSFRIQGGIEMTGEVIPQGAKNEALQVISAVLLTPDPVEISNVPDIQDVNILIEMLSDLGVKVTKKAPGTFVFQADQVDVDYIRTEEGKSYVYVQGAEGKLEKREITTGPTLWGQTKIYSGMEMGEYVAFPYGVKEGAPTEEKNLSDLYQNY